MGTRGIWGFVYKGSGYYFYCNYDAYPAGLGITLINQIISMNLEEIKQILSVIMYMPDKNSQYPQNDISYQLSNYYVYNEINYKTADYEWMYEFNLDDGMFNIYWFNVCIKSVPITKINSSIMTDVSIKTEL